MLPGWRCVSDGAIDLSRLADDSPERQIPWLPGERFELALDSRKGAVTSSATGRNLLTVTTHRAILLGAGGGKRTTSLMPLDRLTGIEVVDVSRPTERLTQGLIVLGVGVIIGWLSWAVVGVALISLIVGGLPVLAAVYMLAGYVFPDEDGEFVLHAGGHVMRQPLLSENSRRDAYLVAHRLYELMAKPEAPPARAETPPMPARISIEVRDEQRASNEEPAGAAAPSGSANGAADVLSGMLGLSAGPAPSGSPEPANVAEHVERCISAMELATGYVSRQIVRDPTRTEMSDGDFVWDFEFTAPDAMHVTQTSWSNAKQTADQWIAIEQDFYRNAGRWQKAGDLSHYQGELALNQHLKVDKYLPLLRSGHPSSAAETVNGSASYIVVEYDTIGRDAIGAILDNPSPPQSVRGHARVWIDASTDYMAKVEVAIEDANAGQALLFEQAFTDFNSAVRVERPVLDPQGAVS
jgi:hypothetical protein